MTDHTTRRAIPHHPAAEAFLQVAEAFKLGALPTEQPHPLTQDLADLSRHDLKEALRILQQVDLAALAVVADKASELAQMQAAIRETLQAGGRIFLYGCGATGRLSLSLGYLWRATAPDPATAAQLVDFMSGGDLALIHSIESFEDFPDYGARQLRELGFGADDLLIASTEGGETPSVIGATREAARLSARKPWFLYCNPDAALWPIARSRQVLEDRGIEKICLPTGAMALSGSTRMQASTVLMLAVGLVLTGAGIEEARQLREVIAQTDFSFLAPFIEAESGFYAQGDYLLYETRATDGYGMTIFTDTTERAPTFSLRGFENQNDPDAVASLSYLFLPDVPTRAEALQQILLRDPVTLEWAELHGAGSQERLDGFDFSQAALAQREKRVAPARLHRFRIQRQGDEMHFKLGAHRHALNVAGLSPLQEQLLLKMALNMHSTLVMGRMGRYESNIMTWVKPSNNKLIDRAIRYVQILLHREGVTSYSYEDICHSLFAELPDLPPDASIVLQTFTRLRE